MNAVDTQLLNNRAVKWHLSDVKPINVSSSFSNVATAIMDNGDKAVLKVLNEHGADIEANGAAAHMGLSASWRLQQGREQSAKGVLRSCEQVLKLVKM